MLHRIKAEKLKKKHGKDALKQAQQIYYLSRPPQQPIWELIVREIKRLDQQ